MKKLIAMIPLLSALCAAVMFILAAFAAIPAPNHPAALPLLLGLTVNAATLQGMMINFRTLFNEALSAAPSFWEQVAMLAPSTTSEADYKWLGEFPGMREWLGEKQVKNLEAYSYVIKNRDFESTIAVDRNDIEDDQFGLYAPRVQGAGRAAKVWPDTLVFALLASGFTAKCFDGQPFFAAAHKFGDAAAFSNKGTAKLTIATQAAAMASYGAARVALMSMVDDRGTPLGITPDTLVVSPTYADVANALMNTDRLEDGKPNLYKGSAKVLVVPYLQGAAWYLLCTDFPVKPLIFQQRKAPVFLAHTDPNSDRVFLQKKYLFGAEARGNAGFGLPQLAYGSDGSV
jgi:phage major head subunit gpT-like protein